MKKKNLVLFALLIGTIFMICSCASTTQGTAKTLEEAHPDRIEKTVIGMDINEFKKVWPEAHRSGINENGETYEFVYAHMPLGVYAYDYKIYTYFYFTDKKLIKYESFQKTGL